VQAAGLRGDDAARFGHDDRVELQTLARLAGTHTRRLDSNASSCWPSSDASSPSAPQPLVQAGDVGVGRDEADRAFVDQLVPACPEHRVGKGFRCGGGDLQRSVARTADVGVASPGAMRGNSWAANSMICAGTRKPRVEYGQPGVGLAEMGQQGRPVVGRPRARPLRDVAENREGSG